MDFKLNDEQLEFQAHCRRFAREVIRPVAAQHDREESVPWEVIKAAREWDLHGLDTIQKMGMDPDGLFSCIYAEELHWGCAGIALAIQGGSLAAAGIAARIYVSGDRVNWLTDQSIRAVDRLQAASPRARPADG